MVPSRFLIFSWYWGISCFKSSSCCWFDAHAGLQQHVSALRCPWLGLLLVAALSSWNLFATCSRARALNTFAKASKTVAEQTLASSVPVDRVSLPWLTMQPSQKSWAILSSAETKEYKLFIAALKSLPWSWLLVLSQELGTKKNNNIIANHLQKLNHAAKLWERYILASNKGKPRSQLLRKSD